MDNGIAAHGVPQVKLTIGEADDVWITRTVGEERSLDLQRLSEMSVHRAYHDKLHLVSAFDQLLAEHMLSMEEMVELNERTCSRLDEFDFMLRCS